MPIVKMMINKTTANISADIIKTRFLTFSFIKRFKYFKSESKGSQINLIYAHMDWL